LEKNIRELKEFIELDKQIGIAENVLIN